MPDSFQPRVDVDKSVLYERLRSSGDNHHINISELLQEIQKDLDGYDSEISSLETRLSFLRSQREWLQIHKVAIGSLLSPIHRLSNELLNEIFLFACAENTLVSRASVCNALSIATVCYRWRLLAISCSSLWSNFRIFLENLHANSQLESCLDIYLERSRQQPLTLYIAARFPGGDPEHPLLSKLVAHSSRWKHLTLDVTSVSLYNGASLRNAVATPSLESLAITTHTNDQPLVAEWILSPSNLRTLSLPSYLPFSNVTAPASLDKVSSLTLSLHAEDLFKPLNWFPSLQHLLLNDGAREIPSFPNPAALPCEVPITSLNVYFGTHPMSTSHQMPNILALAMDFLTAPSLHDLSIINWLWYSSDPIETAEVHSFLLIYKFIERSRCSLTILALGGISIADRYVIDLLKHLRSLVDLTLEDPRIHSGHVQSTVTYPISKGLIESLHAYRPSLLRPLLSPIVPNLYSLVLRVRSKRFDHQSFISTVSSRWIPDRDYSKKIGVACLRSVELHLLEPVDETDYLPLVPFEKSGMRVVVKKMNY